MLQDVSASTTVGRSYTLTLWLRSHDGTTIGGSLTQWALGGTNENATTTFSVGAEWTQVTVTLSPTKAGHTKLRSQIYMYPPTPPETTATSTARSFPHSDPNREGSFCQEIDGPTTGVRRVGESQRTPHVRDERNGPSTTLAGCRTRFSYLQQPGEKRPDLRKVLSSPSARLSAS